MAAQFRALPPGVYFNPTAEECVRDYLKPWTAGLPPTTDRVICDVDVYSDSPGALLLAREPGFSRGFEHKWLMLSRCGGTAAGRGKRVVATGGSWQSEQAPKGVVGAEDGGEGDDERPFGGRRRSFGFYVGKSGRKRGDKTPWLMEEFTALEDGNGHGNRHGGGHGDGTFVVFCRIYLSPRLENDKDKKRQILGDHMVAFDRNGKLKTVRVLVSPEFFDAAVQGLGTAPPPPVLGFQQDQPARRVLGHQQGQPPPPAPRVLGHQQGQPPPQARRVLGYQEVQPGALPPPGPRVLGHQQGQVAATPAVLGGHRDGAVLPRAVPGHHDGQAVLPVGVPAHHHGHAAATAAAHHQVFLGSRQGQTAVQQQLQQLMHLLAPFWNQEASPSVVAGGHYNHRSVRLVDPPQGEAMTHTEKKPRLSYGSPAPQPGSSDSVTSSCVVHVSPCQEQGIVIQIHDDNQRSAAEPVATTTTPPPQEIPGTATAGSAETEPPSDVSAPPPAPAELADDVGKTSPKVMLDAGIYMNLSEFEPGFDEFQLGDFLGF